MMTSNTPSDGYWTRGGFQGDDIWAGGDRNAPFDQPVSDTFPSTMSRTNYA